MKKNVPGENKMAKIQIDGKQYEVKPGKNLLETCLALGLDVPHFCFHPALGSVGACRQCAVKKFKDQDDKRGRMVMSCMDPVTDGMIISIDDDEAKEFRATVIEGLMTNHPHDCPVCDEGGECHLQDMTIMTGHNYRSYDFKKRTHKNQYLGPFIKHEMNRCIQCYRCVRFYKDYAGGKDLDVFASHNHVYFGRHEDGILENEFSGNLVEVCPTGVFTDKTFQKHFTRKWDLSNAPSICVHCSVGCNTIAGERNGSLRRILNRYNGDVNGYFICDRGRFGYEFVNDEKRIRKVKIRLKKNENQNEAENEILISLLDASFSKNQKVIGIGSPRASVESNFALSSLVGKENFYHGISKREQILTKTTLDFLQNSGVQTPSLKQIEKADAIIILGEDLVNTAPMIALAVRQAARNKPNEQAAEKGIPSWDDKPVRELAQGLKSPIFIATPYKDSLDELAEATFHASYADIASLGFAIAASLDDKAPAPENLDSKNQKLAEKIALTLKSAKNPLIISGINCGDEQIVYAAFNIAMALRSAEKAAMLSMVLPESNSMGMAFFQGKPIDDVFSIAEHQDIDTLIILENDLYRRASKESVDHLFKRSKQIIVLDHVTNNTTLNADILLPAATFAESEGTLINNEGRAQRYYKALVDKDQVKESWRWIGELKKITDKNQEGWSKFDEVVSSLVKELPVFSKLKENIPDADFRSLNAKVSRQTMRYSGRTAINALEAVSEPGIPQDPDSPLSFSMEGQPERPPSSLVPFYWAPGWNSVQALYKYVKEPNGPLKGENPGVRLIEPKNDSVNSYFKINPQPFKFIKGTWQIVPVFQIFGGEELSSNSPSIAQRIKEPFVYLNQEDAAIIGMKDGDTVQLELEKNRIQVKLKIENSLQSGLAGLAINLPGMPFVDMQGRGKFNKL